MKKYSKGNVPISKSGDEFFNLVSTGKYEMPKDVDQLKADYNRLKNFIEVNRTYNIDTNMSILKLMKRIEDELHGVEIRMTLFRIMEDFQSQIDTQMDLRTQFEEAKGTNNKRLLKKRIDDSVKMCRFFDKLLLENELMRDSRISRLLK